MHLSPVSISFRATAFQWNEVRRGSPGNPAAKLLSRRPANSSPPTGSWWVADIDVLDQLFQRCVGARRDLFELVEIDHHHIDRLDRVLTERCRMFGICPYREDRTGDLRMHGFDAPVEHFGESRDLADVPNRNAVFAQKAGGAAG